MHIRLEAKGWGRWGLGMGPLSLGSFLRGRTGPNNTYWLWKGKRRGLVPPRGTNSILHQFLFSPFYKIWALLNFNSSLHFSESRGLCRVVENWLGFYQGPASNTKTHAKWFHTIPINLKTTWHIVQIIKCYFSHLTQLKFEKSYAPRTVHVHVVLP
jgi:hypothetical protein